MKKPAGRPSKFKEEYCQQLIDHMAQGLSFETFGIPQKIPVSCLYTYAQKFPTFAEAKKEGFRACQLFWESMGRSAAVGKIDNFNATVWIFNMKNRFQWRDRTDSVHQIEITQKPMQLTEIRDVIGSDEFIELSGQEINDDTKESIKPTH